MPELDPVNRITFTQLRSMLDMTAGNLSTHLRKLEDAGCIKVTKIMEGRAPVTYVGISAEGELACLQHRKALRDLLSDLDSDGTSPRRTEEPQPR